MQILGSVTGDGVHSLHSIIMPLFISLLD